VERLKSSGLLRKPNEHAIGPLLKGELNTFILRIKKSLEGDDAFEIVLSGDEIKDSEQFRSS
jgi:hypothetical protein